MTDFLANTKITPDQSNSNLYKVADNNNVYTSNHNGNVIPFAEMSINERTKKVRGSLGMRNSQEEPNMGQFTNQRNKALNN